MNGLHAAEIDCLLRLTLSEVSPYMGSSVRWLGVFARDELPDVNKERRPFALVLNTDSRSKPGQHWLALFGPKKGPLKFLIHSAYILLATAYHTFYLLTLSFSFNLLSLHCVDTIAYFFLINDSIFTF